MITSLYIENVAVIEKTNIEFKDGFNVLTGETGAGKSILIDAINAVLGHRTSRDIIRTGAQRAVVCAAFENIGKSTEDILINNGFSLDEDMLILQRELSAGGKNICRINSRPAPLSVLRELGASLINIHGQHESYELMSPDRHLIYIDNYGNLSNELQSYREIYYKLRKIKKEINALKTEDAERQRKIDLLKYQTDEIDTADLKPGELEELTEQKNIIMNKEKLDSALEESYNLLSGDGDGGIMSMLRDCSYTIDSVSEYMPELEEVAQRIKNSFYDLQDCSSTLSDIISQSDESGFDIDYIEERLDLIYRLFRKYGSTVEEVLQFSQNAHKELDALEKYERNMENLTNEYNALLKQASVLAKELSSKRQQTALDFSQKVKQEMTYLNMPNVRLTVSFERTHLTENGCDKAEFLISANPGEEPKPVSKIASGGELSRMMLAIKSVLSDNDSISTLIFDEVDTGISGGASQKVGFKLKQLSEKKQVICVTHQAQIASLADNHYLIRKNIHGDRTYTEVTPLNFEQRKQELARIIGGVEITELTLKHAEEMLKQNNQ
ncbi:MAG: DNA repair protein RecN [Acutalibacteraceae bacterium]